MFLFFLLPLLIFKLADFRLNLRFEFIGCTSELVKRLADLPGDKRQLLWPKKKQGQNEKHHSVSKAHMPIIAEARSRRQRAQGGAGAAVPVRSSDRDLASSNCHAQDEDEPLNQLAALKVGRTGLFAFPTFGDNPCRRLLRRGTLGSVGNRAGRRV